MKKTGRKFVVYEKVLTFASSNKRVGRKILFYGVMVAQQILVLFVLVRIRVEQLILVFSWEMARIFLCPLDWSLQACCWLPLAQRVSFFGNIDRLFYTHTPSRKAPPARCSFLPPMRPILPTATYHPDFLVGTKDRYVRPLQTLSFHLERRSFLFAVMRKMKRSRLQNREK